MGHEGDEEESGHEGHEGDEEEGSHEGHEGHEEEGREQDCNGLACQGDGAPWHLIRNKAGKIVSKKKSATAKKAFKNTVGPWCQALAKARKALKITGFVAVKKGTPLYAKAKELYTQ